MGVALAVADALPRSMGLFLGNSMPIRDVDALAGIAKTRDEVVDVRGSVPFGPGAPTAANRGASGIDGVLSAAAGFAAGLGRPATLLVGDVSFQHDANGLLLLRERPGQPPVTVVVVNNGGGGIFSFLPVADQIDAPKFTKLFATPPDVSRRGSLRRASRRARAPEHARRAAHRAARGLGRGEALRGGGDHLARREPGAAQRAAEARRRGCRRRARAGKAVRERGGGGGGGG